MIVDHSISAVNLMLLGKLLLLKFNHIFQSEILGANIHKMFGQRFMSKC